MLKSVYSVHKPLPELAAEQIKELISKRKIKVGEKLPNEFEMAEQLGVGRGTIREAVKILASQNILEIRRGRGTYVSERTGIIDDPLGLWLIEDKKQLALDLCEVRLMLEPPIARLAAQRAGKEEIQSLHLAAGRVEEKIRAGISHVEEDIRFHEVLAKMSKNKVISKLVPVIQSSIALFISVTDSALIRETIDTHQQIVKAVENNNQDEAEAAMRAHLLANQRHIKNLPVRID